MSQSAPARRPTPRQLLTGLRRQEILAAAIHVFGKKGYAATCVEDVARQARLAKGTVYLYFDSKEEIYAAAVRSAVERLHALAAERLQDVQGLRRRLSVAISVRMEFWDQQLNLYRLLLTVGREAQHKRQTHELLRAGHAFYLSILQAGRDAGEIEPGIDLEAIAWAILDLIRGSNERRMERLTRRTPQQDAETITAFALRQLKLHADSGPDGYSPEPQEHSPEPSQEQS